MSKLIKTYFAGSSSNGNTAILYFDDFIFQVDAGCAWKTFKDIPVDYTFITHRHSDHTHNIRKALNLLDTDDCKYIVSKHFKLNIFDVPHSVPNQGFILDCGKDKIAWITDCGDWERMDLDLSACNYVFIECNHDAWKIHEKKNERYMSAILPQLVAKIYHMSNIDTLLALRKWKVNPKKTQVIFLHESAQYHSRKMYDLFYKYKYKIAKAGRTFTWA